MADSHLGYSVTFGISLTYAWRLSAYRSILSDNTIYWYMAGRVGYWQMREKVLNDSIQNAGPWIDLYLDKLKLKVPKPIKQQEEELRILLEFKELKQADQQRHILWPKENRCY